MNFIFKARNLGRYVKNFATTADIYAGTIKSKPIAYRSKLHPPSYGGRYIVSMLPGNFIDIFMIHFSTVYAPGCTGCF